MKREDSLAVVILCGGKGTRSNPYTEHFPKAMMPIGGTPIIVHLMRNYALQGHRKFILAAGHLKEILDDYCDGRFSDWDVHVVDTGRDSDTGERLRRCRPHLNETFFATYGDGLGDIDLGELLRFHRTTNAVGTITSAPLRSQYGAVRFDEDKRVQRFSEKPLIGGHWINAGFFVFDPHVFDNWSGDSLENQVLPNLADRGVLYTYEHDGFWKSMDTSKDQQEFEKLFNSDAPPWIRRIRPERMPTALNAAVR